MKRKEKMRHKAERMYGRTKKKVLDNVKKKKKKRKEKKRKKEWKHW